MARSWPIRSQASSSGMRQSTPMTSPPASAIASSRVAVPVPKWSTGTPVEAAASRMRRVWGSANSR